MRQTLLPTETSSHTQCGRLTSVTLCPPSVFREGDGQTGLTPAGGPLSPQARPLPHTHGFLHIHLLYVGKSCFACIYTFVPHACLGFNYFSQ